MKNLSVSLAVLSEVEDILIHSQIYFTLPTIIESYVKAGHIFNSLLVFRIAWKLMMVLKEDSHHKFNSITILFCDVCLPFKWFLHFLFFESRWWLANFWRFLKKFVNKGLIWFISNRFDCVLCFDYFQLVLLIWYLNFRNNLWIFFRALMEYVPLFLVVAFWAHILGSEVYLGWYILFVE